MADVVDRRSFGAQLARLHRFYDPERILVLQFERCRRDPAGQYRRTLEFLGVRDTGVRAPAPAPQGGARRVPAATRPARRHAPPRRGAAGRPPGRRARAGAALARPRGRPAHGSGPRRRGAARARARARPHALAELRAPGRAGVNCSIERARIAAGAWTSRSSLLQRAPDPLATTPARACRATARSGSRAAPRASRAPRAAPPAAAGRAARPRAGARARPRARAPRACGRGRARARSAAARAAARRRAGSARRPAAARAPVAADEAREHEPAQLALDVLARRRAARGRRRAAPAAAPPSRAASRIRTTSSTTSAVRSARLPATCARSRANPASSHAGPPASAISASSAATVASSSTARGLACGAPASASCAALPSRPCTWRIGEGTSSAISLRVPACIAARWASGVSSTRTPTGVALVDQRRVAAHRLAGAGQRDDLRQRPDRPRAQAVVLERRGGGGELLAQPRPRLLAQRVEVVALGDQRAALVLDAEAHPQVRRQPRDVERVARDAHAAQPLELARERVEQRLAARLEPLEHRRRHLGHGHERPAQLLRQRADQRGDELRRAAPARASRTRSARAAAAA